MWRRKSVFIVGLSLAIAGLVWSQMGMYLINVIFGVSVPVNFFHFCISLFKEDTFYYFLTIILLNTLIAYTALVTLFKVTEQFILLRRFRQKILSLENHELRLIVNQELARPNQDIVIIQHDQLIAFTMGFRHPTIVLSSGLLEILDDPELEAVVHHETHHQKNFDSLKLFVLQLISQAMWYIPVTKWAYQNYRIISELSADEYAIERMGSELGLGSALLKLIKNCFSEKSAPVLAYFADVSNESVNYRLKQLVEPERTIPVRLETKSVLVSVQVLLVLMCMFLVAIT